ncbi:bifunctional GrpB family protein/GNAT family N-acetyltransferase [Pseudoalteromonas luteoviolacea]|uniref:bifunctional GrpB family protein/GNAT family N-acetyltransferase n=1 Tax=Pseudoalteromonas luteoviolacea TaxID=43657 RepID=UPI000AE3D451|nr:bifunctional GrpB family protein/GNAT family N-acetyltransferase [Pseudoalteromonas luteoviolacea]
MKIQLSPYNANWPHSFELEKQKLECLLAPWVEGGIEHVGSTAVKGMWAKPIIDIMVGVKSLAHSKPAIEVLSANGYCYYPYKEHVMHWLCAPSPDFRTHHVHLVPFQSALWHERLKFRDVLRHDAEVAKQYIQLKQALAHENAHDREAYTQNKWPFIRQVLCAKPEGATMSDIIYTQAQADLPLDLLLEADPSETEIASYISGSHHFVAKQNNEIIAACIVKPLSSQKCEICNISVRPSKQKKGVGTQLLSYVLTQLSALKYQRVELGTGTFGYQLTYYQRMGFRVECVEVDYFVQHYNEPLYEQGIQHKDRLKLYLSL